MMLDHALDFEVYYESWSTNNYTHVDKSEIIIPQRRHILGHRWKPRSMLQTSCWTDVQLIFVLSSHTVGKEKNRWKGDSVGGRKVAVRGGAKQDM